MQDALPGFSPLQQDDASGLAYRLRDSAGVPPKACLILLHGVGGNETNLAPLAEGIPADTLVALVRGPVQLDATQFAWFRVAFTTSGPVIDAPAAEAARQHLHQLLGSLQARYGISPDASLIAGFSQGGIMSAGVSLTEPESVAGFAILSGRILPEIAPRIASRERLSRLQALISHGEHDNVLPVAWAERATQWLTELGVAHINRRYPIDHRLSPPSHQDFIAWVQGVLG